MKKTKLSFIALLASLALVGCGGNGNSNGGDSTGGDNPNPSTPAEKTYVVGVKSESKYIVDNVITSKKDIGDAYAMKGTELGEGKVCTLEWFEQAKEIETAVVGKTSSEINSAESFGQATIKVGSLKNAIIEAVDYSVMLLLSIVQNNKPLSQLHMLLSMVKEKLSMLVSTLYKSTPLLQQIKKPLPLQSQLKAVLTKVSLLLSWKKVKTTECIKILLN